MLTVNGRRAIRVRMMTKTCTQCGTEFDPGKRHAAKTCSTGCSVARRRAAETARLRKRLQDPATRAAKAERDRKRLQDPAYRAAEAERNRKRLQDPAYRAAKAEYARKWYQNRRDETVSRMVAMLNSGELAAYGTEPYFLYRFYDEDGALLYVGITNDPARRLYEHTVRKPWADDIARTEYDVYANKTEAVAAEAVLIKELGPLHNVAHNKIPLAANEKRQNGPH